MNEKISQALEDIARAAKSTGDDSKIKQAITAAKNLVSGQASLQQLESELSTWQSKLSVILKEPVGRQGLAKHAGYWAEKLRADS